MESLPSHAKYDDGIAPPLIRGGMDDAEEAPPADEAQSSVKPKTWADLLEDEQGPAATAEAPPASTPKAGPSPAPVQQVKPEVEQSAAKAEPSVEVGPTPTAASSQASEYISSAAQFIGSGTHEFESDFAVPYDPPHAEDDGIGAFIDKPIYPVRVPPPEPRDMSLDEIRAEVGEKIAFSASLLCKPNGLPDPPVGIGGYIPDANGHPHVCYPPLLSLCEKSLFKASKATKENKSFTSGFYCLFCRWNKNNGNWGKPYSNFNAFFQHLAEEKVACVDPRIYSFYRKQFQWHREAFFTQCIERGFFVDKPPHSQIRPARVAVGERGTVAKTWVVPLLTSVGPVDSGTRFAKQVVTPPPSKAPSVISCTPDSVARSGASFLGLVPPPPPPPPLSSRPSSVRGSNKVCIKVEPAPSQEPCEDESPPPKRHRSGLAPDTHRLHVSEFPDDISTSSSCESQHDFVVFDLRHKPCFAGLHECGRAYCHIAVAMGNPPKPILPRDSDARQRTMLRVFVGTTIRQLHGLGVRLYRSKDLAGPCRRLSRSCQLKVDKANCKHLIATFRASCTLSVDCDEMSPVPILTAGRCGTSLPFPAQANLRPEALRLPDSERQPSSRRLTRVLAAVSCAWAFVRGFFLLAGGADCFDADCPFSDAVATPPGFDVQLEGDLISPIPPCGDLSFGSPCSPVRLLSLPVCPPLPSFSGVSPRARPLKRKIFSGSLAPAAGPKPSEDDTLPFTLHVEAHQLPSPNSTLLDLIDGDTRDLLPQYSPVSECVNGTLLGTIYFEDSQGGELSVESLPPAQAFPDDRPFSYSQLYAPQSDYFAGGYAIHPFLSCAAGSDVRLLTRVFLVNEAGYQGWREYPPTLPTVAIYDDLLEGWPRRPGCVQLANMFPTVVGRLRDEISAVVCICLLADCDLLSDRLLCLLDESFFRFAHACRWAQRTLSSLRAIWVYPPHVSHDSLRACTGLPSFVRGAFAHVWVDASFLPVEGQVPIFAGSVIRFTLHDDRGLSLGGGLGLCPLTAFSLLGVLRCDRAVCACFDACPPPFGGVRSTALTGGRPYTAKEELRRLRRTRAFFFNEQGYVGSRDYGVYCTVRAMRLDFVRGWPFPVAFYATPNLDPPGLARRLFELDLSLEIVLLSHRNLSPQQPLCLLDDSFFRAVQHRRWISYIIAPYRAIWLPDTRMSEICLRWTCGVPRALSGWYVQIYVDTYHVPPNDVWGPGRTLVPLTDVTSFVTSSDDDTFHPFREGMCHPFPMLHGGLHGSGGFVPALGWWCRV